MYEQILQKYLKGVEKYKEPIEIPLVSRETEPVQLQAEIVESVGANKSLSRKASNLLNLLGKSPLIGWDERGVVTINNTTIPGSNISDLLNDVLKSRKHSPPRGWQEFAHVLAALNVPREYIVNSQRWAVIDSLRGIEHRGPKRRLQDDVTVPKLRFTNVNNYDAYYERREANPTHQRTLNLQSIVDRKKDRRREVLRSKKNLKSRITRRVIDSETDHLQPIDSRDLRTRVRSFGNKRRLQVDQPDFTEILVGTAKRRLRRLNEEVPSTLREEKREESYMQRASKRPGEDWISDDKRSKIESGIVEGLNNRLNRKRKIVNLRWYNDKYLAVPRKKARWSALRLKK